MFFQLFLLTKETEKAKLSLPQLQKELFLPNYQDFIKDEPSTFESEIQNAHIEIKETTVGKQIRSEFNYNSCSISLSNAEFSENSAFGSGLTSGSGGALFALYSSINSYSSNFKSNEAVDGGAMALIFSNSIFQEGTFESNTAQRNAGALFIQGYQDSDAIYSQYIVQIKGTTFKNNDAGSVGGALVVSNTWQSFLDSCQFTSNSAFSAGGAIYYSNSPSSIFSSYFAENIVQQEIQRPFYNNMPDKFNNPKQINNHAGKGGGAIAFKSSVITLFQTQTKDIDTKLLQRTLYLQENCFFGNTNHFSEADINGSAHSILLDGFCLFISQSDSYDAPSNQVLGFSKSYYFNDKSQNIFIQQYNTSFDGSCISYSGTSSTSYNEVKQINFESYLPSLGLTSYIPSPTTFLAYATPITQIPYPTTRSYDTYPTSSRFTSLTIRTVKFTPKTTPHETPFQTPYKTPFRTPFETPIETPFMTPFETPNPTRSPGENQYYTKTLSQISTYTDVSSVLTSYETLTSTMSTNEHGVITITYYRTSFVEYTLSRTFTAALMEFYYLEEFEEPLLNSTSIIIIVVSVCAGLFIVAGIGVFIYRHRKSKQKDSDSIDELDNNNNNENRNTLNASILFNDGLQAYQDSITSDDRFADQLIF